MGDPHIKLQSGLTSISRKGKLVEMLGERWEDVSRPNDCSQALDYYGPSVDDLRDYIGIGSLFHAHVKGTPVLCKHEMCYRKSGVLREIWTSWLVVRGRICRLLQCAACGDHYFVFSEGGKFGDQSTVQVLVRVDFDSDPTGMGLPHHYKSWRHLHFLMSQFVLENPGWACLLSGTRWVSLYQEELRIIALGHGVNRLSSSRQLPFCLFDALGGHLVLRSSHPAAVKYYIDARGSVYRVQDGKINEAEFLRTTSHYRYGVMAIYK